MLFLFGKNQNVVFKNNIFDMKQVPLDTHLPVDLSAAFTFNIPFASTSKVTSI